MKNIRSFRMFEAINDSNEFSLKSAVLDAIEGQDAINSITVVENRD